MHLAASTFEIWALLGALAVAAILVARRLAARLLAPPPLTVDADDPAMRVAAERARASLDRFEGLRERRPEHAFVRYGIVAGEDREHLWGRVLDRQGERFRIERVDAPRASEEAAREVHLEPEEIEDWQVLLEDGSIEGGYTQRVLFDKARETWGKLPRGLAGEESRYRPLV